MLATKLLEGYSGNSFGISMGSEDIMDPLAYIQEACIEFVTESAALVQQYYTADIVGQSQVLLEGADAQAVMESNKVSLWKRFKDLIKKLIQKIKEWWGRLKKWFKDKFSKIKKSKQVEVVQKAVKKMDKKEPIRQLPATISNPPASTSLVPVSNKTTALTTVSGNSTSTADVLTYAMVPYNMDAGDDCANKVITALADVWTIYGTLQVISVEDARSKVESSIGFPIEDITAKIHDAYGMNAASKSTVITAEIVENAIETVGIAEKSVEVILGNVENFMKALDNIEAEFSKATQQDIMDERILLEAISGAQLIAQLNITANNAMVSAYDAIVLQCSTIISMTSAAVSGLTGVKEGAEPECSDPPEEEEPEEVTEGLNVDAIKKWFDKAHAIVKKMEDADKKFNKNDFSGAKTEYQKVKKDLQKIYDEYNDMNDDRKIGSALLSGFGSIAASVITGLDTFMQNAWLNRTMVSVNNIVKAVDDSNGSKNQTITTFMAKINACINHCDRRIASCEKNMKSGAMESSVWEQAAQYI